MWWATYGSCLLVIYVTQHMGSPTESCPRNILCNGRQSPISMFTEPSALGNLIGSDKACGLHTALWYRFPSCYSFPGEAQACGGGITEEQTLSKGDRQKDQRNCLPKTLHSANYSVHSSRVVATSPVNMTCGMHNTHQKQQNINNLYKHKRHISAIINIYTHLCGM